MLFAVNNKEVILILITAGADINAKSDDGHTALYNAASNGHLEIVKLLIDKGADVNVKNDEGKTALNLAKNPDIISILTKAGAITDTDENKEEKILIQATLKAGLDNINDLNKKRC